VASQSAVGASWSRFLLLGVLTLAGVYYLLPLFVMVITSLKTVDEIRLGNLLSLPRDLNFDAWIKAWSTACTGVRCEGLRSYFWNSVSFVVPAVLISTLIGALNGYVLSHWRFKGSEMMFGMLMIGFFIPFQVVLLPMARTLGIFGLASSLVGLILVHVVYGLVSTTLFFRNFYVNVPDELVKAARIDGAGFFRIFWRILLPISVPIIMVTLIWQFTQIWNDFLLGVVFSSGESQPVTVGLNNLVNTSTGVKEYNVDMAAAIIAALPTLIVYILAGKYFVRGLTAGAVKG
jgi:glucose/mannose transport system permease protein